MCLQETKLTASAASPNDFFGTTVSLSDDTIVVGASNAVNSFSQTTTGSVYIFVRQTVSHSAPAEGVSVRAVTNAVTDAVTWTELHRIVPCSETVCNSESKCLVVDEL